MINSAVEQDIAFYMPQDKAISKMADFFQLFSDKTRVKLLCVLSIAKLCVTDIADILKMNQTTISHQLKILRSANVVEFERVGKIIYYTIANDKINDILLLGVESSN